VREKSILKGAVGRDLGGGKGARCEREVVKVIEAQREAWIKVKEKRSGRRRVGVEKIRALV